MFDELVRRWWILALRGVVAVAFGIGAFFAPERTLAFLVGLFGVFALADGVFAIGAGLAANWLALFLEGVVGGAVGLFTFFYPPAAPLLFTQLIVAWAAVTGILELVAAGRLLTMKKGPTILSEWLLAALGVLSLMLAGLLAVAPPPDPNSIIAVVGGYAFASGALLIVFAMEVRRWPRALGEGRQS